MAEPIFKVACPACGAPVHFLSAASVMAVCSYCQTTLLRDADQVRDMGKISAVLPDYSPIQIGTSGVYEGQPFQVIGRRQLQYEDGYWNEWYALFADQSTGWLSDASGQYVFTRDYASPEMPPSFGALQAGQGFAYAGQLWIAADVRTAKCIASTGELPAATLPDTPVKAADFRAQSAFMTLDWSDRGAPACYIGKAVTLDGMKAQLLREGNTIADTAGRLRGKVASLACPSCGSPISYVPGLTEYLVCPACRTETHKTPEQAEVMATHERVASQVTTLKLGESGNIDGVLWDVIGVMIRRETGETDTWAEYLLFNVLKGFVWLVESQGRWQLVRVMDSWPHMQTGGTVELDQRSFAHLYQYSAVVVYAAGAFNWRVKVGDRSMLNDYRHGTEVLSSEATPDELNWSHARDVSNEQMAKWFPNNKTLANAPRTPIASQDNAGLRRMAWIATIILAGLNLPMLLSDNSDSVIFYIFAGCALIWLPVWITQGI